jgi:GR25 family glycosyltransferase involved in LPS biosynthesis
MNINTYFDKIYLLNLFKRPERLQVSKSKLDKLKLIYDVFNGTDGSVLNHVLQKLDNNNFSNSRYLGCAISHLSIYQDALERGYSKILILEDDNLIKIDIHDIFDNLQIPEWNDLFYLGYIPLSDDCNLWTYEFGIQGHNMINNNIFRGKNLWGLYAYGITSNLMNELIKVYNQDFPMELDRYFVQQVQPRSGSIAVAPQLFCCQEGVYSDNSGRVETGMLAKSIDSRFATPDQYI